VSFSKQRHQEPVKHDLGDYYRPVQHAGRRHHQVDFNYSMLTFCPVWFLGLGLMAVKIVETDKR
jgi:hypothetical protein